MGEVLPGLAVRSFRDVGRKCIGSIRKTYHIVSAAGVYHHILAPASRLRRGHAGPFADTLSIELRRTL